MAAWAESLPCRPTSSYKRLISRSPPCGPHWSGIRPRATSITYVWAPKVSSIPTNRTRPRAMNRADPFDRSGCSGGKFRSPGSIKYRPLPLPTSTTSSFPSATAMGTGSSAPESSEAAAGVIRGSPSLIPWYRAWGLYQFAWNLNTTSPGQNTSRSTGNGSPDVNPVPQTYGARGQSPVSSRSW